MADVPVPLMVNRARRFVIFANLAYAAVLLCLGVVPEPPEIAAGLPDYVAHGVAYGAHTVLLFALLLPFLGRGKAAILAVAGAVLYGSLVEVLQFFQPTRTVEIRDFLANSVGAVVAAMFLWVVTRTRTTGGSG